MARVGSDLDGVGIYHLRKMLADTVSADPSGLGAGDEGRFWFETTSHKWRYWNGSAVIEPTKRSDHTGTQIASTISDLATTVKAYRLDEFATPTADLSLGSRKITSLADGVGAQDGATVGQLNAAIASLVGGQTLKGVVRCAAGTNISLSSPGATIDGVTPTSGDVILLTAQTTGSQNGPYVWTGAATPLTRALNWDTSGEAVLGSYWIVEQGTRADQFALMTNDTAITLGTTTPAFTYIANGVTYTGTAPISVSGGVVSIGLGTGLTVSGGLAVPDFAVVGRKVTGIIPTTTTGIVTVAGATVTINHGLNNPAPLVQLVAYTSPYSGYTTGDLVPINGFSRVDDNNVAGVLPAAPASNNWAYSVIG